MPFRSLVEMFLWRSEKRPSRPALWSKSNGRFYSLTWKEFQHRVERVALALDQYGIQKGDRVGILSENRPEWAFADLGILGVGAVCVPIYATTAPRECRYIIEHAEISTLFLSDAEQLEKVEALLKEGRLKRVIAFDAPGRPASGVLSFSDCLEAGRLHSLNNSGAFRGLASRIRRDDWATMIYTSGTTGPPKGVMLTHGNFLSNCEAAREALPLGEEEESLSFLPLSHVFERMAGYYYMVQQGASIAYAESMQTVPEDLLLVRPTVAACVPRLFEKMHAKILDAIQAGPPLKKKLFFWSLDVGRKAAPYRQKRKPLPWGLGVAFGLAQLLVFKKLKQRLGGRIRFFISGGAPLSKDLAEFFFAAGVLILEGYGLTETSPVISVNRPERFKFGTVGPPLDNVEVRIAADGEILTRGPHVMKGYFKNEEATRESIRNGWFYTGDIGEIDSEGFLKITDRKKDLIVTAGGKNVSPANLEAEILKDPLFIQAVAIGDQRPYIVALIVPNRAELTRFAGSQGMGAASWEELLKHPGLLDLLAGRVWERTKDFNPYEQIKYIHLLPKELSQEAGELTPTLKVKRRVVTERYASAINALYEKGESHVRSDPHSNWV